MVGLGSHQTSPHQAESTNVRQQDELLNLERRQNYQEGSVHSVHTDGSGFWRKRNIFHERDNDKTMQQEMMIWRSNSIEHNRNDPLPTLMSPLMTKKILYTDRGLELHQANPSPVKKSIFIERNARALLAKEWELTWWKRHWVKFLNHPLHGE